MCCFEAVNFTVSTYIVYIIDLVVCIASCGVLKYFCLLAVHFFSLSQNMMYMHVGIQLLWSGGKGCLDGNSGMIFFLKRVMISNWSCRDHLVTSFIGVIFSPSNMFGYITRSKECFAFDPWSSSHGRFA